MKKLASRNHGRTVENKNLITTQLKKTCLFAKFSRTY